MGQGRTAAEDKVSSAMHIHKNESYDVNHLLRGLDEYLAFVSDLGTEVKITEFELNRADLSSIMPRWMSSQTGRAPLQVDVLDGGEHEHRRYHNPLQQCVDSNAFLRNAMPIPGAGHTVHNSVKELPSALDHYKVFLGQLRVVERVLTHPGRVERVIARCILGALFAKHRGLLEHLSYSLHEERWGAIAAFCAAALAPVAVLRRSWSEAQYEENGVGTYLERDWATKSGDRAFKPAEFTAVLRSPLFRHYHFMVVKLKTIPTRLMGWFDGCPCHHATLLPLSLL